MKTLILSCIMFMSLTVVGQQSETEFKLSPEVEESLTVAIKALENRIESLDVNAVMSKSEWQTFLDKYEPKLLEFQSASISPKLTNMLALKEAEYKTLENVVLYFLLKKAKFQLDEKRLEKTNQIFVEAMVALQKSDKLKQIMVDLESSDRLQNLAVKLQNSELVKVLTGKK